QVFPDARHTTHVGLAAELPFGAYLTCDAGDLRGEAVELVNHRVDGVFQLENLATHVRGDVLREVAVRYRSRDRGDVADLRRQVVRHEIDVVGEVLPGARDARYVRLPTEPAFGPDLARDAGDLPGEGVQLIDHRLDGVFQLENLATHV